MRCFRHIGKYIKMKRLTHPNFYSQNELSKKLGYKNGQFISNVERGLCGIPIKGLSKLSEVLDLDREDLKEALIKDYSKTIDNFLDNSANVTDGNVSDIEASSERSRSELELSS